MSKIFATIKYILILSILIIPVSSQAAGLFDSITKKKQTAVELGGDAPDFSGEYFGTGEKVNYLKDLKGKVVLLDFWSIYCVSCLKEIPKLVEIYEKYKDKDVVFIYVDLDTNKRRLDMFRKKNNFNPVIMDKKRDIAKLFNVNILPTTLIIDKAGKLRFFHEGYKPGDEHEIEDIIQKLLN